MGPLAAANPRSQEIIDRTASPEVDVEPSEKNDDEPETAGLPLFGDVPTREDE